MTKPIQKPGVKNPYLRQQIMTASPEKLILMLYELGLRCCRAKDRNKAALVVTELIGALNFDYSQVALSYFRLYRFVQEQIHREKFDDAFIILEGMKEIWEESVMGLNSSSIKAMPLGEVY